MEPEVIPHHHNALAKWLFSRPIQPIPKEREESVLDHSLWSWFCWNWINNISRRGYDRVIVPEDISLVPKFDAMKGRFGQYKAYLNKHKPTPSTDYREIWALLYALRWRLFLAFLLKSIASGCQVGMTSIQRQLIEQAELITEVHGHGSHGKVTGFTLGTCAMDTLLSLCDSTSMYCGIMNASYARTLMMCCIHDKMLRLGPQQRHDYSAAKIMTISSSDCRRASSMFIQINALLVLPVYFGATVGILIYMIGVSGSPGVGVLLLGFVVSSFASYYAAKLRMSSMPYQDKRVSLTRETLKNINIIKFYGWEESFYRSIRGIRKRETRLIRFLEMLDAFNIGALLAAPNLAGALSFGIKISLSTNSSPSRAFPSLTLFQMFAPILAEVSFALTTMADAFVAAGRSNEFFRLPEVPNYVERISSSELDDETNFIASIEHGTFSWHSKSYDDDEEIAQSKTHNNLEKTADFSEKGLNETSNTMEHSVLSENREKKVLVDVNLTILRGTMNLVTGPVGTGKTSSLNTFVNLIPKTEGKVTVLSGIKISSVLSLWSQSCSIQENILFGRGYEPTKYKNVVRICDLQSDFDLFPHGDRTDVGENGVTLSGGQRARLALARCLYADADFIILDDVSSAMDSRVGNHIYSELLKSAHDDNRTILFSTNNLKLIKDADWVFSLDGSGSVKQSMASQSPYFQSLSDAIDSYEEQSEARKNKKKEALLNDYEGSAQSVLHAQSPANNHEVAALAVSGMADGLTSEIMDRSAQLSHPLDENTSVDEKHLDTIDILSENSGTKNESGDFYASQMDEENRAVGSVKIGVLLRYFRLHNAAGLFLGFAVTVSVMCYATSEAMSNVVLNWWTSNRFDKSPGFNLGMYTSDVSLVSVFYAIFANLLSFTATASSTSLHNQAIFGLYHASMSFFQKNPLGRLMMRFTEDMVNLDTHLLAFARLFFMTLFALVAAVVVVFVYIPWVILCIIPIMVLAYILMSFYRTSSREINRCQQLFDSRGMASVSEHIDGQEVIVAFDQVRQSQVRLNDRMDDVISATSYNEAANFWMAFRGGVMCEIMNLVTIFLACFQVFGLNPSEVGTLISILPSIRSNLTLVFPMYALFDNQLNSVERLDEYAAEVPAEGEEVINRMKPQSINWVPTNGEIDFENVDLRYRPGLPLVLNNFGVHMGGGKKIGICGRTGAGKSTIISALFRLVESSKGSIFIDGQDISELPLKTLRNALAIIPQQPVLFQGTIRSNLDPFGEKTDDELINALNQSGLGNQENIDNSSFSLAATVEAEGTNFSLGQRQMLALARAISRHSKISVLDEATAAVDHNTDERIQRTLKSVFSDCTVLCIAHRLETILDYDEILVMGPGGLKLEMGPPRALYEDKTSVFRSMCDEAGVSIKADP